MAYSIAWAASATADLEQIVRFIAVDNPEAARNLGLAIIERVEQAAAFPRSGRVVPEKGEERLRELVFLPYRIVYEISNEDQAIQVVRLWHSARGDIALD